MDAREQAKSTSFEQLDGVCRSSYVTMVRLHLFGRYGFRCEGVYGAACWKAGNKMVRVSIVVAVFPEK